MGQSKKIKTSTAAVPNGAGESKQPVELVEGENRAAVKGSIYQDTTAPGLDHGNPEVEHDYWQDAERVDRQDEYARQDGLNDELEASPGYCRTPKQHQWKKGQSGNPSGRKAKKQRPEAALKEALAPLPSILAQILTEPHQVPIKGQQKTITLAEGLLRNYSAQFMKANLKEKNDTMRMILQTGLIDRLQSILSGGDEEYVELYSEEQKRLIEIAVESIGPD